MDPSKRAAKLREAFPKALTRLRKERMLSMNELAQRSHVSQSFGVQLESGERGPSLEMAAKLAAGLGMSLQEFVAEIESELD